MATLTADRSLGRSTPEPIAPSLAARGGMAVWRLFTSVNFAVVQIVMLALLAVVGMTVRQLPDFAFRSIGDYSTEMAKLRAIYEPVLGSAVVDVMERLQLFHVFTSTWFSLGLIVLTVSILLCTLDRTPRLWRQSAEIRVVQPDAYFDPRLPDRVSLSAAAAITPAALGAALRRRRFSVREETAADGTRFVYGDRNRWTKLATLISHLGLILFLVAGLVTARFGDTQGLVVANGDTLTVQPIGTPNLLLVKNFGFSAPGLDTGQATDYTTDLAVYQNGQQIARKVIRVNDPLTAGGYTFHQNGFGPAPVLEIRDSSDDSVLWSGAVPLTDAVSGLPFGAMPVPGKPFGLELILNQSGGGVAQLVVLPYAVTGTNPDGTAATISGIPIALQPGEAQTMTGLGLTVALKDISAYTLLIAKQDPGQGIVWFAFAALLAGLAITFYLPRRRVWARFRADGTVDLVGRADRHVEFEREFGEIIDRLVGTAGTSGPGTADGASAAGGLPPA
ncbi:MAG TPA: cytochrome c biogenesis protein ResB [Candidatus Limnocylindrales bacterium]|nr:cytochrome c biogenesis protein ResB [Candidatus Limnocylindrales bacterium]